MLPSPPSAPSSRPAARALRLLAAAGAMALLAIAGCAQLAQKERELVFRVEPGAARWYSGMPAGISEINIPLANQGNPQHVHAWWWPAASSEAPALLYLHGSRWNLTGQLFRIEQLRDFGFSVLAIDYRGFGKSTRELPSEQSVYEDARAAWEQLAKLQPDPARRLIYGHSLGSAVAVDLAAKLSEASAGRGNALPARGLIIESSFTTLADMARALIASWLPVELILSQEFDSVGKIARVRVPVLVVHGTNDRYVPVQFSRRLYEAAATPKQLLLVQGGSHNNSMRAGNADYRKALGELFGLGSPMLAAARR